MSANLAARQKANAERETTIKNALDAIFSSGKTRRGRWIYSFREAARDYKIPKSTLIDRGTGGKTRHGAATKHQRLAPPKEDLLVEWIKQCGARGLSLTPAAVMDAASQISGQRLGVKWYRLFQAQHNLDLKGR
jgi:hypothetical protein